MILHRFSGVSLRYNIDMKRGVKITFGAIGAVAIIAFVIYWNNPAVIYRRAISRLSEAVKADDAGRIDSALSRIESNGEWGELEKAVKSYVSDQHSAFTTLTKLQNDQTINTALNPDKLSSNGPKFEGTLAALKTAKNDLTDARKKFSYIKTLDKAVEHYCTKLNEDLIKEFHSDISEYFAKSNYKKYADSFKMMQGVIDVYTSELELLANYPKAWKTSHDKLKFSDSNIEKKYQKNLEKVLTIK